MYLCVVYNDLVVDVPKLLIFIYYLENPDVIDLLIAMGADFSLLDSGAK